jgi:hypothetical protein
LPVEIRFFFKSTGFTSSTFPIQPNFSTKPTGRHYTKYRFSPDIASQYQHIARLEKHASLIEDKEKKIDYHVHFEEAELLQKPYPLPVLWWVCRRAHNYNKTDNT